MYINTVAHSTL